MLRYFLRLWCSAGLAFVLSVVSAHAGLEAANWYFGDSVFVQFDAGGPVRVGTGAVSTGEGCAAWSDAATGAPLLYTDGRTVWNGAGVVLNGGTGLLGHASSTQSALLVPQPGVSDRFFLFTAGAGPYEIPHNNGIRYSFIDLALNSVTVRNSLLLEPTTEKLTAVPHCNGTDYWVLGHGWGSDNFYAWPVTASGVGTPVVSSTGAVVPADVNSYTIGHLKASPDGRKLVSTGYYPGAVQLFDFNNSTGVVSNPLTLPFSGAVYGASFSPGNTKLYIVDQDGGARPRIRMYQYTVTGAPADILASRTLVFEMVGGFGDEIGALQIAPDGRIYCAREGGLWLGVITSPEADGAACNYVHNGLNLGGRRSLLGLPNMINAVFNTGESCFPPRAAFWLDTTLCAGMCLELRDESLNAPAAWQWEFPGGNPAMSAERHPVVCYAQPGVYDVRLVVVNSQGSDTLERRGAVTVLPRLGAFAGGDTAVCAGEPAVLRGGGGAVYHWEPADGVVSPDSAVTVVHPQQTTTYVLTVRDGTCIDRDTVTVTVHPPPVVVGGLYDLCAGDTVRHEAAGTAGRYRWEPQEGVSHPDTSAPLLFPQHSTAYTVTLTDGNGCTTTAVVRVVVGDAAVDAGPDTAVCRGNAVRLEARGLTGAYRWTPAEGLDDPQSATPLAAPQWTTTYVLTVTGGTCTAVDSVTVVVHEVPLPDAGEDQIICRNGSTRLVAAGEAVAYRWEPVEGLEHPDSAVTVARPQQTTTYRLTLVNEYGCTATDSVMITVDDALAVDAGEDAVVCAGDSVQLDAFIGEGTYRWTPAEGLDDPTSPRPRAFPQRTTVYRLSVQSSGCTGEDSLTVTVVPAPAVDAGADVVICRGDTVQLHALGDGLIEWQPSATLDDATRAAPRAFPDTTTVYIATVRSASCVARDSVVVTVRRPAVALVERDTAICPGSTLVLHAAGGDGDYAWEPAALVDDPRAAAVTVRPTQATTFVVTLTDRNGCRASDSITVSMRDAAVVTVALPDTVAVPGTTGFRLPVWVQVAGVPASGTTAVELALRYDRRLFEPTSLTRGIAAVHTANGDSGLLVIRIAEVQMQELNAGSELTALVGTVLLSATDSTALEVEHVDMEGLCTAATAIPGRLRIDGYCFGRDVRRFSRPQVQMTPNPAADEVVVHLGNLSPQECAVSVVSLWGEPVPVSGRSTGADARVVLDISSLPAGVYYLTVEVQGVRFVEPLCIVR